MHSQRPYRGLFCAGHIYRAELIPVVKTQAEALEGDVTYDYCMITTKCLPDVLPTPKLVEEIIASKKIKAWSLIQVGWGGAILNQVHAHTRTVLE